MSESVRLLPQHKKFADAFLDMYRAMKEVGVKNPWVGRSAALYAGYGMRSWTTATARCAADLAYQRLTKRPDVLAYLADNGLEKDGKYWKQREQTTDSSEAS